MSTLTGKIALVTGIANEQSIAYGIAKALKARGAELIITYVNDRTLDFIQPVLPSLEPALLIKCDVTQEGDLENVFQQIGQRWGKLDIALHSIAFAPKADLHGRVVDTSRDGFLQAMDVSCHSFVRLAKQAEPLMKDGGTLITLSYYGAEKVVPNYGVMGPVKAALEATTRYLAVELGPKKIRVHAVSPGPVQTRAASGIPEFSSMLEDATQRAPLQELVDIDDVGAATAFLCEPGAAAITGSVFYVDGGMHILA
ncbi:enoyl-ACP reductase FabI [Chitiniphilus eburneus]|uniref:Enoyl-[acyl-carrier-protein] reductase [NADH] n=1 Tax=Chitiniphilus eburneus TaxID=2571148 RepID=A0A4U0Q9G5_9NEIS|nr:enoyl-ACP reductase FabI [Chitiniphilus eburneus]TJZ77580.1 enoyl-ACP reductase FabI [Chitiniphilus eburneus]